VRLTRRFAVAAAAAMLAAPLLSPPAAHADGSYDCFFGDRKPSSEGYDITANSCDGGGGADVVVKVRSGSAAGTHRCRIAFSWNGFLNAQYCREE